MSCPFFTLKPKEGAVSETNVGRYTEELKRQAVELNGAPAVGLDQGREIRLKITAVQSIGRAVEMLGDPPHGAGVGLDGLLAFALTLQYARMAVVQ